MRTETKCPGDIKEQDECLKLEIGDWKEKGQKEKGKGKIKKSNIKMQN